MIEEKESQELMKYIFELSKEQQTLRDEESKRELRDLTTQLNTLSLSKGLIYNSLNKLKVSLISELIDKDEYSDFVWTKELSFYFDSNYNFMALTTKEINLLSNCIKKLLIRINILYGETEDKRLREIESQEEIGNEEAEEKLKEIKKQNEEFEESLFQDEEKEILEEEEEVVVPSNEYIFECLGCGYKSASSYMSGCKKCGETLFQMHYLKNDE